MRKHTGEIAYKCDICGHTSCKLSQKRICLTCFISVHIYESVQHRKTHEKNFKCQLCEYKTTSDPLLQIHIRQIHTLERPYKCDQCDFAGASKASLKAHSLTHATGKNFICEQCSKAFKTKGQSCLSNFANILYSVGYSL